MKFSGVEAGQRFKYKGASYVKSSPLVANHEESGQQKFFRRADNVEVNFEQEKNEPKTKGDSNAVPVNEVMKHFDLFYSYCIDAVGENLSSDLVDKKNTLITLMEKAKFEFINNLKK